MNIDQINIASGGTPILDLKGSIEEVLREGGWTDTDVLTSRTSTTATAQNGPNIPSGAGEAPASPGAAIQGINFG